MADSIEGDAGVRHHRAAGFQDQIRTGISQVGRFFRNGPGHQPYHLPAGFGTVAFHILRAESPAEIEFPSHGPGPLPDLIHKAQHYLGRMHKRLIVENLRTDMAMKALQRNGIQAHRFLGAL